MLSRIPDSADPFSLAARSRSYYVNLRDSSPLPPKGESFLSLSNDSEALYRSPRRERPVSFQNMPLPSIFSPPCRRDRRERIDPAWMLEESSPELEAQDHGENADVTEITLDGMSDWRQIGGQRQLVAHVAGSTAPHTVLGMQNEDVGELQTFGLIDGHELHGIISLMVRTGVDQLLVSCFVLSNKAKQVLEC